MADNETPTVTGTNANATENAVEYGLSRIIVWPIKADGSYDTDNVIDFDVPTSFNLDRQSSFQDFYAKNRKVATVETDQGFSGAMTSLVLPDAFKEKVLGYVKSTLGDLLAGGNERSGYCGIGWEFLGDVHARRCFASRVKCANLRRTHTTTDTGVQAASETIDISATPRKMEDGTYFAVSYISDTEATHTAYEAYFSKPPHSTAA